jgi:hypothetical protein
MITLVSESVSGLGAVWVVHDGYDAKVTCVKCGWHE